MFLISWNVAGWSSATRLIRNDFGTIAEFLRRTQADIVCLQEVKGSWQKLQDDPRAMGAGDGRPVSVEGWESFWSFSGKKYRGLNGVATFARRGVTWWCDSRPFIEEDIKVTDSSVEGGVKKEKGADELNDEGRVVVTGHSDFVLVNTYVVNGRNRERITFKMRFLAALKCLLARMKNEYGKPIILVGDLNVTFRAEDAHWSLRRISFPSCLDIVHRAQTLDSDKWEHIYPYLKQEMVCPLVEYIAEQTLHLLAEEAEEQKPGDARSVCTDKYIFRLMGRSEANSTTKISSDEGDVRSNNAILKLVQRRWEHKLLQSKGASAPVTLSELCEADVTWVCAGEVLRPQQTSHNRNIFALTRYCGLPPHDEACVEFVKQLLDDLHLRDAMSVGLTTEERDRVCPCPYTCWDQSRNRRMANEGSRIDYILIDDSLAPKLSPCCGTENNIGVTSSEDTESGDEVTNSHAHEEKNEKTPVAFYSEFDGVNHMTARKRVMACGAYPPAAMDGTGLPPLRSDAKDLQFRGLPSTGLFVTPPQYSDHCGVCAHFPDLSLELRSGKEQVVMSRAIIAEKATLASDRAKEFISSGGSIVSRARSLVSGDAQFFSVQPKPEDLRRHLNSDCIHEKSVAMKRIIAQMCKGYDMSSFFADVVKNIHSPSIELRKLIYFFVTHYAEERPNEALLSISAFQKDLIDHSMHVRSLALRMLSAMRIPAIHTLVMVAVQRCAVDTEPLVRKTAAISLAQVYAVNGPEADMVTINSLLQLLLADKNSEVAAAAALSFLEICPDEVGFIHKVYRNLCRIIGDCDEWGQMVLIHLLLRYVRTQFCDPNEPVKVENQRSSSSEGDKSEHGSKKGNNEGSGDDTSDEASSSATTSSACSWNKRMCDLHQGGLHASMHLDSDHRLALDSVKPLLTSLNSAVVVAATAFVYHCGLKADLDACTVPLLRLLAGPEERHAVVLSTIHTVVLARAESFVPYIKEFFLMPHDNREVRTLKLNIISKLATVNNFPDLFREFRHYARSYHVEHVIDAVRGLGLIAVRLPSACASQIMRILLPLLSHKSAEVISEAIAVVQLLVVQGNSSGTETARLIYRLLQQLVKGDVVTCSAKAIILWLVGESIQLHSVIAAAAPECFRVFVKSFKTEDSEVKKQVLMLGCKIWLFLDGSGDMVERFKELFFYLIELARFDDDYDVRDHARLVCCATDRQSETFEGLKRMLLNREKKQPQSSDPYLEHTHYELGSLSHFIGKPFVSYLPIPPWATAPSDPLLRIPPGYEVQSERGKSDDEDMSGSDYDGSGSVMDSESSGSGSSTSARSSSGSDGSSDSCDGSHRGGSSGCSSSGSSREELGGGEEGRNRERGASPPPRQSLPKADAPATTGGVYTGSRRAVIKITLRRLGVHPTASLLDAAAGEAVESTDSCEALATQGLRSDDAPADVSVIEDCCGADKVQDADSKTTVKADDRGEDRCADTAKGPGGDSDK